MERQSGASSTETSTGDDESVWRTATVLEHAHEALGTLGDLQESALPDPRARYDVREVLGVGGMGEVRLCRDAAVGRDVALKTLRTDREAGAHARGRFLREARVQGQLEHPAIVPVYDLGTGPAGELYFAMRRVRGQALSEVLAALARGDAATQASYSRRKLLGAFVQVCYAVDYAHNRGVIHRDLKPANVMLGDFGEVYVLDWGVARVVSEHATGAPVEVDGRGAPKGRVVGTPGYMPPEQLLGLDDEQDARTDVYALGAILYALLTLRPLHDGRSVQALAVATLAGTPAPPSAVAPDVPPELDAVCLRATARERTERFVSARALAAAVERYLDGDRDTERRRALAEERARAAGAALARATAAGATEADAEAARAEAMREVTAALALHPEQPLARRILVDLLVDVPVRLPPAVAAEHARASERRREQMARFGFYILLAWLACVPWVMASGVRSWRAVGLPTALNVVTAAFVWWLRRRRVFTAAPARVALGLAAATIGALACWLGPFVLVPQAAAICTFWVALQAEQDRWRWTVSWAGSLMILAPLALEWLGLVPPSYAFRDGALVLFPRAIALTPTNTIAQLVYTSVTFTVLPALLFTRMRDAQDRTERKLLLHAWQLRQLAPDRAVAEPAPRPTRGG